MHDPLQDSLHVMISRVLFGHMVRHNIARASFDLAIDPHFKVPILIGVIPIKQWEFFRLDHGIPIGIVLGQDDLPRGSVIHDSIMPDGIFSNVQPSDDIHILID